MSYSYTYVNIIYQVSIIEKVLKSECKQIVALIYDTLVNYWSLTKTKEYSEPSKLFEKTCFFKKKNVLDAMYWFGTFHSNRFPHICVFITWETPHCSMQMHRTGDQRVCVLFMRLQLLDPEVNFYALRWRHKTRAIYKHTEKTKNAASIAHLN